MMPIRKSLSVRSKISFLSISVALLTVVISNPTAVMKTVLIKKTHSSENVQILNNQLSGTQYQHHVPGINLLHRELPPTDDNDHGTNVAGVLRAVTSAPIMPIKSLDSNGTGLFIFILFFHFAVIL